MYALRNEQFQEELWKRSFEFLKDHLSPETVDKYSPPPNVPTAATEESSSTHAQTGEPQDGASEGTVATGEKVTAATEATSGGLNEEGVAEQQPKQD